MIEIKIDWIRIKIEIQIDCVRCYDGVVEIEHWIRRGLCVGSLSWEMRVTNKYYSDNRGK